MRTRRLQTTPILAVLVLATSLGQVGEVGAQQMKPLPGQAVCVVVPGEPGDFLVANATVTAPDDAGFATVHEPTADWQASSTVNFSVGRDSANLSVTEIGVDGRVCVTSFEAAHLILDVIGTLDASVFTRAGAGGAVRVLDTRRPGGPTVGGKALPGQAVCVVVPGEPGDFLVANATVTAPDDAGFATVHEPTADWQASSTVNFSVGRDSANLSVTEIGVDGRVCVTSFEAAHLILDVIGTLDASVFTRAGAGGAVRVLDTRESFVTTPLTVLSGGHVIDPRNMGVTCVYFTVKNNVVIGAAVVLTIVNLVPNDIDAPYQYSPGGTPLDNPTGSIVRAVFRAPNGTSTLSFSYAASSTVAEVTRGEVGFRNELGFVGGRWISDVTLELLQPPTYASSGFVRLRIDVPCVRPF